MFFCMIMMIILHGAIHASDGNIWLISGLSAKPCKMRMNPRYRRAYYGDDSPCYCTECIERRASTDNPSCNPPTDISQDSPAYHTTIINPDGSCIELTGYHSDIDEKESAPHESALHSKHIDIGDGEGIAKAYREYASEEPYMAAQNQIERAQEECPPSYETAEKNLFTVETFPIDEKYLVFSDKWDPIPQHAEIETEEEEDDIPILPERLYSDKR